MFHHSPAANDWHRAPINISAAAAKTETTRWVEIFLDAGSVWPQCLWDPTTFSLNH